MNVCFVSPAAIGRALERQRHSATQRAVNVSTPIRNITLIQHLNVLVIHSHYIAYTTSSFYYGGNVRIRCELNRNDMEAPQSLENTDSRHNNVKQTAFYIEGIKAQTHSLHH